jgi:hypothetical protein
MAVVLLSSVLLLLMHTILTTVKTITTSSSLLLVVAVPAKLSGMTKNHQRSCITIIINPKTIATASRIVWPE